MNTDIEYYDQKRMRYLEWYLVAFVICLALLVTRHFCQLNGLNTRPAGHVILGVIVITLLIQLISVVASGLLERDINQDPLLNAALNNEFVRSIITQSWIAAYIAASATTLFFAVTWSFYPICDPLTISLTSISAGAGASRAYFYIRYKLS